MVKPLAIVAVLALLLATVLPVQAPAAGEDGPSWGWGFPACPLPPGTRGTCVNPDGTLSSRR